MYLDCSLILAFISMTDEISASKKDTFPTWYMKMTAKEKALLSPWIRINDVEMKCSLPIKKDSKQAFFFVYFS